MSDLRLGTWDLCEVVSPNFHALNELRLQRLTSSDLGLGTWDPCEPALSLSTMESDSHCWPTYTLSTPDGVGHQWMESTSIGCNQCLSLAKIALKVPPVGRNCSLVASTSMCGEGFGCIWQRFHTSLLWCPWMNVPIWWWMRGWTCLAQMVFSQFRKLIIMVFNWLACFCEGWMSSEICPKLTWVYAPPLLMQKLNLKPRSKEHQLGWPS